jgi:copper resistance protein B
MKKFSKNNFGEKIMKKQIITAAFMLMSSPAVLAAGMDCTDPMHAQMDHCKQQAKSMAGKSMKGMDHSKMNHGAMKGMDHSKMNHGAMAMKPAIPVSDGSLPYDVPLPYKVAKMEDDPVLTKFMLEQLEIHDADGKNPLTWEAEAWIGKDINKLWFKTEGERVDGETEELEVQALYSRAIAPYWDFQVGLRKDFQPESREWGVLGLKGLAPYFFETDLALFAGKDGRTAARLQGEYELLLTQKTILTPEIEVNLYGKDDPAVGVGSGLSDVSVGLRLRHEFRREFAPYIGVEWNKKFGGSADYARDEGADISDTQFVAGIRAWF